MLYHPEISSIRDQEQVTHAVAYALAQQCLGDVLAPEWWDDVGLNQGLAVFMEYIGVELVSIMRVQLLLEMFAIDVLIITVIFRLLPGPSAELY